MPTCAALGQKQTCAVHQAMSALPQKVDVAFRTLTTDLSRLGRPLFRHPDCFAAIRTSLLFRLLSWCPHVSGRITDTTQSTVDDMAMVHSVAATETRRFVMRAMALTICSQKRTCVVPPGMSALGQKQT